MEVLGIGLPELFFVIIIALLILGPRDMQKAGKTVGKFLRDLITSDGWKLFQQTSRDLRTLPNRLMREANEDLNKVNKDINQAAASLTGQAATPPSSVPQSQPYTAMPAPAAQAPSENVMSPQKDSESETQTNG